MVFFLIEQIGPTDRGKNLTEPAILEKENKKKLKCESDAQGSSVSSSSSVAIPCMDRLREELSCAVCVMIHPIW